MPGTPRLSRGGGGSLSHKKPDRLSAKAPRNGVKPVNTLENNYTSTL